MLQEFVDEEFKKIKDSAEIPSELEGISKVFSDYIEFRSHGFEFVTKIAKYLQNTYNGLDIDVVKDKLCEVALNLHKLGKEKGLRYDITDLITPQELALKQSVEGVEGITDRTDPYKPFILRENHEIDINNLNSQRIRVGHTPAIAFYFGLGGNCVIVSLEPLDNNGNTIRDPQPLDEQLKPIQSYTKSANFPFRRD